MLLGFLLFCPPSLCQQIPSSNTELSVTGVTIGSCRYSVEGCCSVYGIQLLKCYQLPIRKHTHDLTCRHTHTHTHHSLFASSSHSIIADTGKFGLVATRSDQMRKQRTTFWLFILSHYCTDKGLWHSLESLTHCSPYWRPIRPLAMTFQSLVTPRHINIH